jgi:hypothetical protein
MVNLGDHLFLDPEKTLASTMRALHVVKQVRRHRRQGCAARWQSVLVSSVECARGSALHAAERAGAAAGPAAAAGSAARAASGPRAACRRARRMILVRRQWPRRPAAQPPSRPAALAAAPRPLPQVLKEDGHIYVVNSNPLMRPLMREAAACCTNSNVRAPCGLQRLRAAAPAHPRSVVPRRQLARLVPAPSPAPPPTLCLPRSGSSPRLGRPAR